MAINGLDDWYTSISPCGTTGEGKMAASSIDPTPRGNWDDKAVD